MEQITLTLTIQEAQAILQVLGEMPTKSGAFPLLQKLGEQLQTQTKKEPV
jgi:hypothetical protein